MGLGEWNDLVYISQSMFIRKLVKSKLHKSCVRNGNGFEFLKIARWLETRHNYSSPISHSQQQIKTWLDSSFQHLNNITWNLIRFSNKILFMWLFILLFIEVESWIFTVSFSLSAFFPTYGELKSNICRLTWEWESKCGLVVLCFQLQVEWAVRGSHLGFI